VSTSPIFHKKHFSQFYFAKRYKQKLSVPKSRKALLTLMQKNALKMSMKFAPPRAPVLKLEVSKKHHKSWNFLFWPFIAV